MEVTFTAESKSLHQPPRALIFWVSVSHYAMESDAKEKKIEQGRERFECVTFSLESSSETSTQSGLPAVSRVDSHGAISDQFVRILKGDGDLKPLIGQSKLTRAVKPDKLERLVRAATFPALIASDLGIAAIGMKCCCVLLSKAPQNKTLCGQREEAGIKLAFVCFDRHFDFNVSAGFDPDHRFAAIV